jgi:hypothetical protein
MVRQSSRGAGVAASGVTEPPAVTTLRDRVGSEGGGPPRRRARRRRGRSFGQLRALSYRCHDRIRVLGGAELASASATEESSARWAVARLLRQDCDRASQRRPRGCLWCEAVTLPTFAMLSLATAPGQPQSRAVPRQRGRSRLEGVVRAQRRGALRVAGLVCPAAKARAIALTSCAGARRAIAWATRESPGAFTPDEELAVRACVVSWSAAGPEPSVRVRSGSRR